MNLPQSYAPTWDLLICTIPHRHAILCELLSDLDAQITACNARMQVGARLYRDNLTVAYGDKTRVLLHSSLASYVSCVDDDDLLAPGAMARILAALDEFPDYVGFTVAWTRNGVPQIPVEHSLRRPAWQNSEHILLRSVMQFNPIRRDVALDGTWAGGYEAERRWQEGVLAAGRCKREVFLPDPPAYLYRERTGDTFKTPRTVMAAADIPPLPAYPWLHVLAAEGSC